MQPDVRLLKALDRLIGSSGPDHHDAINDTLSWLCLNAPVDHAALFWDGGNGQLICTHSSHTDQNEAAWRPVQGFSSAAISLWATEGRAFVRNVHGTADDAPEIALLQGSLATLIIVPMHKDGQLVGAISFGIDNPGPEISEDDMTLLALITGLIGGALTLRATQEQGVEVASRLEATLAALPSLLFEIDAEGRYTGFMTGPEHLMFAAPTSLAGKTIGAVLPADVAATIMAALRDVLQTGSTRDVHYRLNLADGPHDFELTGARKPAADPDGRPSAIFLVREVTSEARQSEELLRLSKIVEVMGNLVVITDVKGQVTWANSAFEKQTGWRLDEIRGQDLGHLVRCAESDPAVVRQVNIAVAEHKPFTGEMINQDRNGKPYWVDFNIWPLFGPDNKFQGVVSVETVISRLKKQEAEMEALAGKAAMAQARLENALMALPDGVIVLDADERVVTVNGAYLRTFPELAEIAVPGAFLSDLLRAGIGNGLFPDHLDSGDTEAGVEARLAQYRQPQYADEVQLPDGRWLRRINSRTSDGGCISVGIDITARKKHLAALDAVNHDLVLALEDRDAARQRLIRIMDGAKIGTWEWDIVDDAIKVGGHWGELIGFETKSIATLGLEEFRALVHAEDRARLDRIRPSELGLETDIIENEFRMKHLDGHWVWILSRSRVTERSAIGDAQVVVGVHIDISEQKRLEHELIKSRAYLSQIMETSVSAVAVMGSDGMFSFANPEAERVLGLAQSEIVGRSYRNPAWQLERIEGGPLPEADLPSRLAIAAGKPVRDIRFALQWNDGNRRILSCNAAPLNLDDGQFQVVVSFTDVTEQLMATKRIEDALLQAEEMSRAKSTFLANMSHEIRTPLNGVLGMAEVLASLVTEPDQKRMIETIRKSGDTLLTVLNGILDMSKIESGKMVLEEVPFSPLKIMRQVEAIYAIRAEEKGIEFEVLSSAGCEEPRLGDPHRIHQILNNLLDNAFKFTQLGSVQLKMTCRPGKPLTIEVSDTGIGMDDLQVSRVFESFEQADGSTTRRFGGTGLGLSIVSQLVKLMGGEVSVTSALGRGTKIRITLELPESEADEAMPESAPNKTMIKSFDGVRLLCADDNEVNLLVLREMLAPTGAIITEVENGQQAIEAWAESLATNEPFAMLMLDIAMPVCDGLSALAEIRAAEHTRGLKRVPAIAVTANAMANQVSDYIVGGFDTHLAKPFKQDDLFHALSTLL